MLQCANVAENKEKYGKVSEKQRRERKEIYGEGTSRGLILQDLQRG